ncbi:MAG: PAS domain-containing protein [Archaeoglobaceae archaeon]
MTLEKARESLDRLKIIWAGFGFVILFWILESALHAFIFNVDTLYNQLFYPGAHEVWMRSLVIGMIFAFSLFAQYMVNIHRKAEEKIRGSHAELDQIFNTAADGMRVVDRNYNILRVNETFSRMTNMTVEEASRRKCYEVFSGSLCHTPECPLNRIMNGKESVEYEAEKERRDGEKVPCIVYATPFRDPDGRLVGIVEDFRDITERKVAEKKKEHQKNLLQTIIDSTPDFVVFKDRNLVYKMANNSFCQFVGKDRGEIVGKTDYDIFPPPEAEMFCRDDVRLMETGQSQVQDEEVTGAEGKLWLQVAKTPVYNSGEVVGLLCSVRDITERKMYEDALRESEGKLNAMLQSIGDHMSMMDKDLNIIWANDVAKQNFGEDIVGRKCYEVYHGRTKPCEPFPCLTLKAFEDGEIHEHETSVIDKNGETIYFHCTANVGLRDDEGDPVGVIEISRDVTNQKLIEMSLEREMKINAAVANLSSALLSPASIGEMSNLVLEHAKHLTQSKVGYVGYIDPQTGYMISPTMEGEVWEGCQIENKDTVFRNFGDLWGWVLNNKEPILTNTPLEDPRSTGLADGHISIDRFLAVPATIDEELVGLISLGNSQRDYTERDLVLVERLADLFAIAIKRKQTEDELQRERNKLETIVGAIEYGLLIVDKDKNVIYQNNVLRDIFGDAPNNKCSEIYECCGISDNCLADSCPADLAFQEGTSQTIDKKTVNSSGDVKFWENTASPIKNANGEIVSALVVVRDITERKKTEEALQEEKNKLEAIIGAMNNGLSIQDREFTILYQNDEHKKIVGDCVGQKCYRAVHGREEICEKCQIELAFKDGKSHTVECEYKLPSGEIIYLENTANPIRSAKGEINSCLEVVRDISNKKLAEKQIRKSLEEKDALLKEIHHRVKNNLQVISSLINLQSRYIKDDKILEVLKESQNRIKSMALVHEKMYQSEELSEFDFTEYLRTLVSHLIHSYGCGGKVNLNMDVGKIYLNLDTAIPCSLIINELVSNSLKHAFPDHLEGGIDIKFHRTENNGFMLMVGDNGRGFPEEIDYRNTDSLGLQLVNSLTKQLNGEISLHNDKGTTFEIVFPEAENKQSIKER